MNNSEKQQYHIRQTTLYLWVTIVIVFYLVVVVGGTLLARFLLTLLGGVA